MGPLWAALKRLSWSTQQAKRVREGKILALIETSGAAAAAAIDVGCC